MLRAPAASLGGVFALAGLGFWHAGVQPLWEDETYGLLFAQRPLPALLHALATSEPHLPPYFLLLRAWQALAGPSAFAERWLSVACLVLTGVVVYRLATMLAGPVAGWLAFGFWTVQPEGFWYGQEVRMYAPLIFWTALATLLLWRALRGPTWRAWLLFSLAELAALWTHYAGAFVVLLAAGTLLLFGARSTWRQAAGWLAWPALTYLPWLWYVRHIQPPTARPSGTLAEQVLAVGRGLLLGYSAPLLPTALAVLLMLVLAATLLGAALSRCRSLQLAALPVAVIVLTPLVVPPLHFLFSARYLSLVCPLFCVLWAVAVRELARHHRLLAAGMATAIAGGSLAGMAVVLAPSFRHWYAYPPEMAFVRQHEQAGQLLVENSGVDPTARYYYQDVDQGTLPLLLLPPYHPGSVPDVEHTAAALDQHYSGVWLPLDAAGTWDGDRVVERALNATLIPAGRWQFQDVTLHYYLTARGLAAQQPFAATFAGSIELLGYGVQRQGNSWLVALHWRALRSVSSDYTVFVHALDAAGRLISQADGMPEGGRQPTRVWTPGTDVYDLHRVAIPANAPGARLIVGWYEPATNRRLLTPSGADRLDLGALPAHRILNGSPGD